MRLKHSKTIYLFILPAALLTVIFSYLPMVGIYMAFTDYDIFAGTNPFNALFASDFVGLKHFINLLSDAQFWSVFKNTLEISFLKIIFLFPLPIILAILLNEVVWDKLKKVIQTIIYLPNFLSWVIVAGIWLYLLGGNGIVNNLLINNNFIKEPIPFMTENYLFRIVLIISDGWKGVGWSAIIYLAAITGIDSQLYEAIKIDGGSKFREMWHVTLPGIANTIIMMFILRVASLLDAGFDQIFTMYSPYVYEKNDIISTYVYRTGIGQMEYSKATAIGLFNSIIAFILIIAANKLAKKFSNKSIW